MQKKQTELGYILVLEPGDELIATLRSFATQCNVDTAFLRGLGAVDHLVLGYFRPAIQEYERRRFDEELEVLTITGSISLLDEEPKPHVHGIFGRADFSTIGGHVFEAVCSVTLEIEVIASAAVIRRGPVEYSDLELMRPEGTS